MFCKINKLLKFIEEYCSVVSTHLHKLLSLPMMQKSPLELALLLLHGPLINAVKVAELLSYPTQASLTTARSRGRLPFEMHSVPGRKGYFARTADVSRWMESIEVSGAESGKNLGGSCLGEAQ